ncbi:MAG TPA: cation:proton antiporter, partial [Planctomycetota bacterium]|nr:cation:proton antiporter [Planctomycetota bacterium]
MGPHLLEDLALVCCTAALTAVLCHRLKQPVVLGYLLAGVLVGRHVPMVTTANEENVRALSEIGVTLLMFSIGLGFSLRSVSKLLPTAGVLVATAVPLLFGVGFLVGQAFGWSTLESVFGAATLVVSSSMLLERSLRGDHSQPEFRDLVFGVTIVEDLVAVVLLAVLGALVYGDAPSAGQLAGTVMRLVGFLAVIIVAGLVVLPPIVRAVARVASDEVSIVASVGLCFAFAWIASSAGYSVAMGAFLAGMLIAESGAGARVSELVAPLRDVFAAIFFVSVGMLLDPTLVLEHWGAVLALLAVVVIGRASAISLGAFLTGFGIRDSVRAGLHLAQIGEFSFIIAAIGVESGAVGAFLYPVAVAVAAFTALLNPWFVRASPGIAALVERRLPQRMRTFASLYAAWLENWRSRKDQSELRARLSRLGLWLAVDLVLLAAVIISSAVWYADLNHLIAARIGDRPLLARGLAITAAALASLPFAFGTVRMSARIATLIAESAMPLPPPSRTDPAYTPRRALAVSLQLALVLIGGLLLQAVTQAFVPPLGGII